VLELARRRSVLPGASRARLLDEVDGPVVLIGIAATAALLVGAMLFLDLANLDVWTATITALALMAIAVPIFHWIARRDGEPALFRIFLAGFAAKLLFSLVRYFFIFVVYNSEADAGVYHEAGAEFVRRFRQGVPIHPLPIIRNFPVESQRIGDLTGVIYVATGSSAYAGFFVFSTLCFIGQLLYVRALKVAVPEADFTRYAKIIVFLPSLLFWPSSIGKESLMIFCLGIITYGAALLLAPKPRLAGGLYFALGSGLVLLIRPHIALMSIVALIAATAVGALAKGGVGAKGRAIRIAALVGLLLAIGVVSTSVSSMFQEQDTQSIALSSDGSSGGTASQLETTLERTSRGNSEFTPPAATSPEKLPFAVVSVLLRPFPWEAHSLNSLISAAEGVLLGLLLLTSIRRIRHLPALAMRRPFLVFVASFVLVFSIAFSFVGNFGILARQRSQMLPAALVVLALPVALMKQRRPEPDDEEGDEQGEVPTSGALATVGGRPEGQQAPRLHLLTVPQHLSRQDPR
jgi:hypothetical protein